MKQGGSSAGANYRKGHWSVEEDIRLIQFVRKYGEGRWSKLAKAAGLQRCGKSCRLRWVNYLRPDIKRGHISEEEERLIIKLHSVLGNRWSLIAIHLPGRSDNEIKNYWRSHIKKKLKIEDLSNIDTQSSHMDSLSSEGSQNGEDHNVTLIEGACYNMLGLDGPNNLDQSLGSTTGCETLQGADGYYLHNSINNIGDMMNTELMLPSHVYNVASNYNNLGDHSDEHQLIKEDTGRLFTCDTITIHEPPHMNVYNELENPNQSSIDTPIQGSIDTPRNIQDPNCFRMHGESWDFYATSQLTPSIYNLNPNQPHPISLHDSEVPWDVESVQSIVEAHNPPLVTIDSSSGFELWDNELFSSNDPKYQAEQKHYI